MIDMIKYDDFVKVIRRWGFETYLYPDMGSVEICWNQFKPIKNSNLAPRMYCPVISCYCISDSVSRIFIHMPQIIKKDGFRKYVYTSLGPEMNNDPVCTGRWLDSWDEEIETIEQLDKRLKEAIFLIKWSIDFQNSDMLDKARTELRSLPKEDEAEMFERKFTKIENAFRILLDDTRITFSDENIWTLQKL